MYQRRKSKLQKKNVKVFFPMKNQWTHFRAIICLTNVHVVFLFLFLVYINYRILIKSFSLLLVLSVKFDTFPIQLSVQSKGEICSQNGNSWITLSSSRLIVRFSQQLRQSLLVFLNMKNPHIWRLVLLELPEASWD